MCSLSCCYNHVFTVLSGQYEWNRRTRHSSIVIKDSLYCWGGDQKDLPRPLINDSKDKRKSTSFVNVFRLPTFEWERRSIIGNLPEALMGYACTTIKNNVLYFGGSCKPLDGYHNNLYELNSLTNEWEQIVSITPDNGPIRKRGCGLVSFNINGKYNLLVLGGLGPTPIATKTHFQYVPHPNYPNLSITNEMHTMCLSSSPGIT